MSGLLPAVLGLLDFARIPELASLSNGGGLSSDCSLQLGSMAAYSTWSATSRLQRHMMLIPIFSTSHENFAEGEQKQPSGILCLRWDHRGSDVQQNISFVGDATSASLGFFLWAHQHINVLEHASGKGCVCNRVCDPHI